MASRVLVLLLFIMVTVHAMKHTDPRKVKPIPPKSDIIGDGNCFYRTISQYLYENQESHGNVRQDIMTFMSGREEVYRPLTDHNGDYESFISRHRRDREWAVDAMVQAAADLYGINIIVNSYGNSGALQVVRARSHQGVESWLHLAHSASHYDIISDSSQEGAVEPQHTVDLHAIDIYSLNTPEHDKIIPDDEVTKINDPLPPEDAVDNICYGIIGDGNCFYRAVAQYLFGDQERHGYIRQVIINFMSEREDEYRRFTVYDHNGDYGSFLRQHRQEGAWVEAGIVQATADHFGFSIYVSIYGNSGAPQIVRARSDQRAERWLHLRLEENHYEIISDSFKEDVKPQHAGDLRDNYSLNTPEHCKIIPDDEVTEDAVNNICNDLQNISLRGKKKIDTALFEGKQTDEKIAEIKRELSSSQNLDWRTHPSVENLGRLDNHYVELEGEEETPGEIYEPIQIDEVLSSEEEETYTEVPPDKKPDVILPIKDLDHLRSLIENGEVQFGSHFRVTRRRCFFEYYHHYLIIEANDQYLTVVHVTNTQKYHVYIECIEENIFFSDCSNLLDFASGVELLYKYEIPTNESALEAITLRMQHMLSLDFVNYSLTSRIHNKINCASLVSYILTGEKDHSDVHDFIHRYGIFAILVILSVECICSCFLMYQVKFRKNVLSKLKGKLINRFGIAKLQITDWMYSLFGIVNNCIVHPVVKLWIILRKNVFKRKRDGKKG